MIKCILLNLIGQNHLRNCHFFFSFLLGIAGGGDVLHHGHLLHVDHAEGHGPGREQQGHGVEQDDDGDDQVENQQDQTHHHASPQVDDSFLGPGWGEKIVNLLLCGDTEDQQDDGEHRATHSQQVQQEAEQEDRSAAGAGGEHLE